MLGLLAMGLVTCWIMPKKLSYYVILIVAVLVGARLTGPELVERYLTVAADKENRDESAQSRLDMQASLINSIAKNPVLGAGPDHWPLIVSEYGWPPGKEGHQNWLQVWAEFGLPGVFFLAGYFAICLIRMPSLMRTSSPPADPLIGFVARMVFAALVG